MSLFHKAAVSVRETDEQDPRLGHLLGRSLDEDEKPEAVLVGFPSDEGVVRNGGRPGASQAPDEIRTHLYGMTPDAQDAAPFISLIRRTKDAGNLKVTGDLEHDQQLLGEQMAQYLEEGTIPIILGGGHETAYAHFLSYVSNNQSVSIMNIDAHTDVRPLKEGKAHSGSAFRQALEHEGGWCRKYLLAGLQPHSVARSHLDFIAQHKGSYLFRDETNITSVSGLFHELESEHLMVTFDIDAVDQAYAPGVSAPCINGLQPDLWLTIAYLAGRNKQVSSFDLSETNPEVDRDHQTVRLAALTIWHFLLGLSQRAKK